MITIALLCIIIALILGMASLLIKQNLKPWQHGIDKELHVINSKLTDVSQQWQHILTSHQKEQQLQRERFDEHQIKSLKSQQEHITRAMQDVREQMTMTLGQQTKKITEQLGLLTEQTQKKLKEISQEVDKQLCKGFEKTTATFTDIVKRLTIIDQAQKKITELSTNVVSLQDLLADKRSRGAFGEVQLNTLIKNMIPEQHFSFQHTLSNGRRADCILFLPSPTGNLVIDAKFPLENFHRLTDRTLSESQRQQALTQFKIDIKKHINDIANKYIIEKETADGAIMFIPAEAIFSEIHAHHPDLVELAQHKRVWLVSPTTLMAVITTARAVLKDEATRKQVHLIQEHLVILGKDFSRFQKRMDNLAKHIDQAQEDVSQVHKSSQKISSRFSKIEQVELSTPEAPTAVLSDETTA